MKKTVLITGGTGMVGRRLTEMLLEKNYEVAYLSRRKENIPNVTVYRWDIDKGYMEAQALETADYIVHLAGAGIADARWTAQRKREIIESRTKSIELIANELQGRPFKVKACVAASAIGFYGANTGDEHLNENHPSGTDFLAHVTRSWEQASERMDNVGVRTTKLRIGIVLSSNGGALPKIAAPIRLGVGAPLASGEQWVSWIHLDDLCRLFIEALENPKWSGIYNAVGAQPVTNAQLTRQIADVLNRPLLLPHIPAFVLQLVYGEMADVVLGGNYVLNQRIAKQTDFQYSFSSLTEALQDLLAR